MIDKILYKSKNKPTKNDIGRGQVAANLKSGKLYTKDDFGNIVQLGVSIDDIEKDGVFITGYLIQLEYTAMPCGSDGTPVDNQIDIDLFSIYNGGQRVPLTEVPSGMTMTITGGTFDGVSDTELASGETIPTYVQISGTKTSTDIMSIELTSNSSSEVISRSVMSYVLDGTDGNNGTDGTDGSDGGRGSIKYAIDIYHSTYTASYTGSGTAPITKWRYTGQTTWYTSISTTDTWSDLINNRLPTEVYKQVLGDEFHFSLYDSDTAAQPVCIRYCRCDTSRTYYNSSDWDFDIVFYVDGSMIVDGTVYADALEATAISGQKIYIDNTTNPAADPANGVMAWFKSSLSSYAMKVETTNASAIAFAAFANNTGAYLSGGNIGVQGHGSADDGVGVLGSTADSGGYFGLYTNQKGYIGGTLYPFTGAHLVFGVDEMAPEIGDIVSCTGATVVDVNNSIIDVEITKDAKCKRVIGVCSDVIEKSDFILRHNNYTSEEVVTEKTVTDRGIDGRKKYARKVKQRLVTRGLRADRSDFIDAKRKLKDLSINSVGEGAINVCSANGNIESGDYICSSPIPGKGMKQPKVTIQMNTNQGLMGLIKKIINDYMKIDIGYHESDVTMEVDLMTNYTVAKALEPVDWSKEKSSVKMIACTYHCG